MPPLGPRPVPPASARTSRLDRALSRIHGLRKLGKATPDAAAGRSRKTTSGSGHGFKPLPDRKELTGDLGMVAGKSGKPPPPSWSQSIGPTRSHRPSFRLPPPLAPNPHQDEEVFAGRLEHDARSRASERNRATVRRPSLLQVDGAEPGAAGSRRCRRRPVHPLPPPHRCRPRRRGPPRGGSTASPKPSGCASRPGSPWPSGPACSSTSPFPPSRRPRRFGSPRRSCSSRPWWGSAAPPRGGRSASPPPPRSASPRRSGTPAANRRRWTSRAGPSSCPDGWRRWTSCRKATASRSSTRVSAKAIRCPASSAYACGLRTPRGPPRATC